MLKLLLQVGLFLSDIFYAYLTSELLGFLSFDLENYNYFEIHLDITAEVLYAVDFECAGCLQDQLYPGRLSSLS